LLREVGDVFAPEANQFDSSLHRSQFADNALEQCRLPGAVGADHGQQASGGNFAPEMVNRRMPVVAERQVIESDNRQNA
jgi:hypothetical protein